MDNKLLLVKSITLLYRESLILEKVDNSSDLVRTVLEEIKTPEITLSINTNRDSVIALKETALYLCNSAGGAAHDKDELLQRLKVNCDADEKLYEALSQGIEKDMDEASLKRTVVSIRKYINDTFREGTIIKMVSKASRDLLYNREKIPDIRKYVRDVVTQLEPYQIETNGKDPAVVGSVDLGDTSSLNDAFEEVKEMDDRTGLLVTGWQGYNRMFQGGIRRGETHVIGALQHNYKTGFSLTLFKQIAMYNTPVMINPAKKPLLLRISFEDSLALNLQFLYQNVYENEHKVMPVLKDVTTAQMAKYVQDKMQVTGYHVKLMRVNPSEWTYKDIQNQVLKFEAEGYELHLLMLDYLPMLPTTGCEQGSMGHDVKDMYKRMRNFCSAKKISMVTPHQLSTEAKQLMRDGSTDFVKNIANKGYYALSKQIDQEVDAETYIHIESLNGASFLTIQRGKHRIPTTISHKDKYIVLPFPEKGSIPDDLNLPEITRKKVGGGAINTPDENPFWSYTDK